jgi:hypothetical protein
MRMLVEDLRVPVETLRAQKRQRNVSTDNESVIEMFRRRENECIEAVSLCLQKWARTKRWEC